MKHAHPSDQQLLLNIEGELSAREHRRVAAHLEECWACRARRQELEDAIAGFIRAHEHHFDSGFDKGDGPRALLKARLDAIAANSREPGAPRREIAWVLAIAACCVLAFALFLARFNQQHARTLVVSIPNPALTPGATVLVNRRQVCNESSANNKPVPVALERRVLAEYGIGSGESRAYEVDYLVTPALGGADDIHNLWPHSYSSTVWNAQVKDALENRMRDMVCSGNLDLATAQREIAADWIGAYKKYFRTDQPLAEHCAECLRQ